jgi:hypothetical protein
LLLKLLKLPGAGWLSVFLALVCGVSLFISGYAIWATAGHTVLLPVPLFLIAALYFYRSFPGRSVVPPPAGLLQMGVVLFAATLLFAVRTTANHVAPGQVATPSRDIVFYSKTTYPLTLKGTEAITFDPFSVAIGSPQPYHYYELWANALLAKLTPLPALLLFDEVVATILLTVLFAGFVALYGSYFTSYWVIALLATCSVFLCGTYWMALSKSFLGGFWMYLALLPLYAKLTPVAIFLLLGFLFARQGCYAAAAWTWAALAMVYTTVAPVVCLGGGAFALYLLWRRRSWSTTGWSLAAYVAATLWVGGFYLLASRQAPAAATVNYAPSYLGYLPKAGELKIFLNYFIGVVLSQGVYYGLYFVIIGALLLLSRRPLRQFWQENEAVLVAIALFALAATVVGTLFKNANDGYQLGMNLLLPLIIIGLSLMLAATLRRLEPMPLYGAGLAIVLLTAYNYYRAPMLPMLQAQAATPVGQAFIKQVAEVEPELSVVGATLLDRTDYASIFDLNTIISNVGTYLPLVRDNTVLVSLSTTQFDQPKLRLPFVNDTTLARSFIATEPLTQFVHQERLAGRPQSLPASQVAFLQQHHINFICASPRAVLPPELQSIVKRELKDPVTGQKFYVLTVAPDRKPAIASEQHVRWMW